MRYAQLPLSHVCIYTWIFVFKGSNYYRNCYYLSTAQQVCSDCDTNAGFACAIATHDSRGSLRHYCINYDRTVLIKNILYPKHRFKLLKNDESAVLCWSDRWAYSVCSNGTNCVNRQFCRYVESLYNVHIFVRNIFDVDWHVDISKICTTILC